MKENSAIVKNERVKTVLFVPRVVAWLQLVESRDLFVLSNK